VKQEPLQVGLIVRSTQGRDRGKAMVVIDVLDNEYALLADGKLRKLDRPKKKKRKHFVSSGLISEEIRQRALSGQKMNNALLRAELERVMDSKPEKNGG